jgi:spermidine synthase
MVRAVALLLTVATGFSGLVYEVTWQKYLATLLGSHSEATAAVLGIFLGGLSVGYSLFGAVTRRIVARAQTAGLPPRLLLAYGLLEVGVGLYAIVFPALFGLVRVVSFWIPHAAGGLGFALDVSLAALLIGPPTVLMGGTIPMLTQALARSLTDATRYHAFVYAFNTAGAFAGALAAAFLLIPRFGLAGVMLGMGVLNLTAGATFVFLGLRHRGAFAAHDGSEPRTRVEGFASYAAVALLSGFAMMALQTVLIRLGGLSFGSSEFTFAMVVAVFVLCIALGSFGVSALPSIRPSFLLINQWALVLVLTFLYARLPEAPYWAHVLRTLFRDNEVAFYPYYFAASLAVLALLAPAVLLSGATLPLLFHHLRRQVGDLGAVAGRIYSWNTLGSLLGALLGGYALLIWLDLHHVYRIAVGALVIGAAILTLRLYAPPRVLAAGLLLAAGLGAQLLLPAWDPLLLSAGLFRERRPLPYSYQGARSAVEQYRTGYKLLFHDDDPTTSASVMEKVTPEGETARVIYVNGKPDSSTFEDYPTMGLAALLSSLFAEQAERGFVVGYGTGVTVGELASLDSIHEVVVAEISAGVLHAAPLFDFANRGASYHPKVRLVRSDAYRALLRSKGGYDVIVSEPSNPWVTGIEMLYSREFLEAARGRLSEGGVYVQWFHQYNTDLTTVALVLRTFASVFDSMAVWYGVGPDLLLLGFREGAHPLDLERLEHRARRPDFAAGLQRCGVTSIPELLAHELLPLGVVHAAIPEGPLHTLDRPLLNHQAGRAFFRGIAAPVPFTGSFDAARVGAQNSLLRRYTARSERGLPDDLRTQIVAEACANRGKLCATLLAQWQNESPGSMPFRRAMLAARSHRPPLDAPPDPSLVSELSALFPDPLLSRGSLGQARAVPLTVLERVTRNFLNYYQHAAPFDGERMLHLWTGCRADSRGSEACRQGQMFAQRLLHGPKGSAVSLFDVAERAQLLDVL